MIKSQNVIQSLGIAIILFICACFPLLTLLMLLLITPLLKLNVTLNQFFVATISALFFALVNTLKTPESDMLVYIEAINLVSHLNFFEVFDFKFVSLRSSEFVFNLYLWVISLTDTTGWFFSFFSVFFIYFTFVNVCYNFFQIKSVNFSLLVIGVLFFSITFSLTGHLVRQYMAAVFFLLGVSYLHKNVKKGYAIMFLSIFIHNSMAPFLLLYPLVNRYIRSPNWFVFTIFSLFISFLLSNFTVLLRSFIEVGFLKNDGDIPLSLLIFDLLLFSTLLMLRLNNNIIKRSTDNVFSVTVLVVCCLVVTFDIKLLFLRYYFIMDFLRPFAVISLLLYFNNKGLIKELYSKLFLFCGFIVFLLRLDSSPWDYGNDSLNLILGTTLLDLSSRLTDVWW